MTTFTFKFDYNNKQTQPFTCGEDEKIERPFGKFASSEKKKIDECESGSIILMYDAFILVSRKGKGTLHLMLPKFPKGTLKKYFLRAK